jgi:hypothetical protein
MRRAWVVTLALALVGRPAPADKGGGEPPDTDCLPAPAGLSGMVPDLNILKTPSSPALAVVGGVPVDIERATTPMGAAASLGSGIAQGLLVPGTNTAVEVTPYWLWPRPWLTDARVEETRGLAWARNLSFSLAATSGADPAKSPDDISTTDTGTTIGAPQAGLVALGVRTTLWPGTPSEVALACMARIDNFAKGDVELRSRDEAAVTAAWEAAHPVPKRIEVPPPKDFSDPNQVADYQAKMTEANKANAGIYAATEQQMNDYHDAHEQWLAAWTAAHGVPDDVVACASTIHHRVGFVASVAGAAVVSAPDGDFKRFRQGGTSGQTAWLTAGYSWFIGGSGTSWDLSLLGALRVRRATIVDQPIRTDAADFGLRGVAAFARWGFSVQGMRLGPGTNSFGSAKSWQGGVAIDYHLKSGYWLTVTAGSTDLANIDSWSAATALIHLQYNVGRNRLVEADTSTTQPPPEGEASR